MTTRGNGIQMLSVRGTVDSSPENRVLSTESDLKMLSTATPKCARGQIFDYRVGRCVSAEEFASRNEVDPDASPLIISGGRGMFGGLTSAATDIAQDILQGATIEGATENEREREAARRREREERLAAGDGPGTSEGTGSGNVGTENEATSGGGGGSNPGGFPGSGNGAEEPKGVFESVPPVVWAIAAAIIFRA